VEDQDLQLVQTTLGATIIVQVYGAPSFINPSCSADRSYFSYPNRIEVVLSSVLRASHEIVYDAARSHYTNVALIVQGNDHAKWYYVGTATLQSVLGTNGVHWKYTYELAQKLPYDLWTSVGGYKKWLVAVGDQEHSCLAADECMEIARADWGRIATDVQILRYEGDSLLAVTNADERCVIFHYKEDEFDNTSKNASYRGNPNDKITFYTSKSHDIVASASWVISKQAALSIIERFVTTGSPGEMTE
jgi:hypothetical protein